MSAALILSSPPRTFARSPTTVESSSPLPSPRALLGSQIVRRTPRKFRTAKAQRDGFSGGFNSARGLLQTKVGAENVPISSPLVEQDKLKALSPQRFKSPVVVRRTQCTDVTNCVADKDDPIHDEDTPNPPMPCTKAAKLLGSLMRFNSVPARIFESKDGTASQPHRKPMTGQTAGANARRDPFELPKSSPPEAERGTVQQYQEDTSRGGQPLSPLNIDRAIPRRGDWTPTKNELTESINPSPSIGLSRSFSGGLMGSFGYNGGTAIVTSASRHEIDRVPTKRRRIKMLETSLPNGLGSMPPPRTALSKTAKTAPKKALTITGLATSNYVGKVDEQQDPTILDQFLSTQARVLEANHNDITSEIAKVKAVKKQRVVKKPIKKSALVSPASAIKDLANQHALFGSASQLARDESPSLLRDTLDAIRQSESLCSPVRTQDTERISVESTTPRPEIGLSRFTKKRGLWAAAGRDEDNALLHEDTLDIDNFDTPGLRQAFPGKDVLLQATTNRIRASRSPEGFSPSLRGGGMAPRCDHGPWDIDAMDSPIGLLNVTFPRVQARTLHTTSRANSPRKGSLTPPRKTTTDSIQPPASKVVRKRAPKKPAFTTFTDERLRKQVAGYGLKPIKSRVQMIALLEKCWIAKHATAEDTLAPQTEFVEEVDEGLKHGDHLSNVHSLANRPIPKEKKAPKPRKPKEVKEPKLRNKREPKATKEEDSNALKVARKRKSRAALLEEKTLDIDDIEISADADVLTEAAQTALADAAIDKVLAQKSVLGKSRIKIPKGKRAATPIPPTSPISVKPALAATSAVLMIQSSTETNIDSQITLAITTYKAAPATNHQQEPTWHEKILMYDPIVLEDLAAWLNTVGLGAIGEDREVSALEVREWCEQRGVCCLWRGGWRGNKAAKE